MSPWAPFGTWAQDVSRCARSSAAAWRGSGWSPATHHVGLREAIRSTLIGADLVRLSGASPKETRPQGSRLAVPDLEPEDLALAALVR
jgi:hypothetical protein